MFQIIAIVGYKVAHQIGSAFCMCAVGQLAQVPYRAVFLRVVVVDLMIICHQLWN